MLRQFYSTISDKIHSSYFFLEELYLLQVQIAKYCSNQFQKSDKYTLTVRPSTLFPSKGLTLWSIPALPYTFSWKTLPQYLPLTYFNKVFQIYGLVSSGSMNKMTQKLVSHSNHLLVGEYVGTAHATTVSQWISRVKRILHVADLISW